MADVLMEGENKGILPWKDLPDPIGEGEGLLERKKKDEGKQNKKRNNKRKKNKKRNKNKKNERKNLNNVIDKINDAI